MGVAHNTLGELTWLLARYLRCVYVYIFLFQLGIVFCVRLVFLKNKTSV